jgi:hypothetical protein
MRAMTAVLVAASTLSLPALAPALRAEEGSKPYFQVDLSKQVNTSLYEAMLKTDGNDLASLGSGASATETPRKTLKGVPFRLDGVILVGPGESSNGTTGEPVPLAKKVEGIPIGRKAEKLFFLHATHWSVEKDTKIGAYLVHYADGSTVEIPLRYGVDLVDWWAVPGRDESVTDGQIAWTGTNTASSRSDASIRIRLFLKTWQNPHPDQEIKTIDMVTGDQKGGPGAAAPFLVGLSGQ